MTDLHWLSRPRGRSFAQIPTKSAIFKYDMYLGPISYLSVSLSLLFPLLCTWSWDIRARVLWTSLSLFFWSYKAEYCGTEIFYDASCKSLCHYLWELLAQAFVMTKTAIAARR